MNSKLQDNQEGKKIFIIIFSAVILLIVLIFILRISNSLKKKDVEDEKLEVGVNEHEVIIVDAPKVSETRKYKNLDISNIKIVVEDDITKITADVTNNTPEKNRREWISINVLDEENNIIESIAGHIPELDAGQTEQIKSQMLSNGQDKKAYDIEITEYEG